MVGRPRVSYHSIVFSPIQRDHETGTLTPQICIVVGGISVSALTRSTSRSCDGLSHGICFATLITIFHNCQSRSSRPSALESDKSGAANPWILCAAAEAVVELEGWAYSFNIAKIWFSCSEGDSILEDKVREAILRSVSIFVNVEEDTKAERQFYNISLSGRGLSADCTHES